jgi:hypothetical protein
LNELKVNEQKEIKRKGRKKGVKNGKGDKEMEESGDNNNFSVIFVSIF